MDQINFYYLQRVLESELDLVQTNVLASLKKARQDLEIIGVHSGAVVTQNAPPDLNVLASGPGLCSAPDGERIYWAAQQTVDCSQDHLGAATAVVGVANERWLSVIAEFDQVLSLPVTDGNGVTVYTRITDSFNLYVTMAVEQVAGTNLKPALPTDGVLLADICLVFGQVQILAADINIHTPPAPLNRRQDLVHEHGTNIATFYHGTLVDAVDALFGYVDALATAAGVVFAATETWLDASTIAAVNVNGAINEILTDLKANAGAARTGSAAHATVGNYCDLANAALQTNLNTIADNVAGHINGGAPAHADTAITSAAQAGTPESWAGGSARGFLTGLLGHVNDRTERDSNETVTGAWTFDAGSPSGDSSTDREGLYFENSPRFRSLVGGTNSPQQLLPCLSSGLQPNSCHWSHPWSGMNTFSVGNVDATDIAVLIKNGRDRRVCVLYGTAGDPELVHFDPHKVSGGGGVVNLNLGMVALPPPVGIWYPESMCSDGTYLYVMFYDTVATTHRIQSYDITGTPRAGWPATGYQIPGVGTHPFVGPGELTTHHDRIKVVAVDGAGLATFIATANYWQPLNSGESIGIFDAADPTTNILTDGDAADIGVPVNLANSYPFGGLASDGTNIFLTWAENGTGYGGVYTAKISDGSDPGLTGMALSYTTFRSQEIINDGAVLWVPNYGTPQVHCYNISSEAWNIKPAAATTAMRFAAFDGLGVWIQDVDAAAVLLAYRVPSSEYWPVASGTQLFSSMVRATSAWIEEDEVTGIPVHNQSGRMCFDGDGVWMITCNVSATALSGIVRRLPRAGVR